MRIGIKPPEKVGERLYRWDGERWMHIRPIDNGFLIEVRGGIACDVKECYAARTPEDVVEIVAQLLRVDATVVRGGGTA